MTALSLLAVGLAACAVCWRICDSLVDVLTVRWREERKIEERKVAVEERRITLEEARLKPREKAVPMPADLRNRIAMLEDDWAREDEERTIMALYAELDDWDKVRGQLRPLASEMGAASVERPFTPNPEFIR